MRRNVACTCFLLLALALASGAAPARARDLAEFMPADTLLYVGWNLDRPADDPEVLFGQRMLDSMVSFVKETDGPESAELARAFLDLVMVLQNAGGALGLFDVQLAGPTPDVQVALVLETRHDVAVLEERVRATLERLDLEAQRSTRQLGGVDLTCLTLAEGASLLWGVRDERLVIGLGETAVTRVFACMSGEEKSLANHPEFRHCRAKTDARTDGNYFCFFANVARIVTRGREIATELMGELPPMVDPVLEESGVNAVPAKYVHFERRDDHPGMTAYAHVTGPMKGLLKIWDQAPLSQEDLEILPQDAYWAEVWNLDLTALWKEVLRITEELAPDALPMVEGSVAMLTPMLGFSIPDQLLPAFGDTWALCDAPDHGGILLTGTVLMADANDPAVIQGALTRLIQLAGALAAQEEEELRLTQKTTMHGAHEIHYLLIGGVPAPVAPAWGFVNDRFVFGLWPQTVAAALDQVDPKTRAGSLRDHPDVKAALQRLPKNFMAFGFLDTKYVTRLLYPLVNALQTVGVSMVAPAGMEIDLAVMPTVAKVVAGAHNLVGVVSRTDDGVLYRLEGDTNAVALVAGGTLATSVMLPSLARARLIAKRAASSANLRQIGTACQIYAADNEGSFPPSLDVLVEQGLITSDALVSPLDDDGPPSYWYIAGQGTAADPRNVLAYDIYAVEGTNVLFCDGYVEFVKHPAFDPLLEATFERLGVRSPAPLTR